VAEHSVTIGRVRAPEPNIAHTIELAQRVAIDRLRIFQLDLEERAREVLRRSTWIGVGIFCLLAAWVGLLAAAVFALAEWIPMAASLLAVAASQLFLGAGAILWGRRARVRA
jgi:hypothetical protein